VSSLDERSGTGSEIGFAPNAKNRPCFSQEAHGVPNMGQSGSQKDTLSSLNRRSLRLQTSPLNVTDWSEFMRVNRKIRPELYADAIDGAVSAASAKIGTLDVSFEAKRIAKVTGFSAIIAARDLIEASVAARVDTEFTRGHLTAPRCP
jgi:hypothetical protein